MPRRQVIVDSRFRQYGEACKQAVAKGLEETGQAVARHAHAAPTQYHIASVLAQIESGKAIQIKRGQMVEVVGRDWRTLWFEKGTYAKRGRLLSRRTSSVQGNRGIKPQRMLKKALTLEAPGMTARIQRHMP